MLVFIQYGDTKANIPPEVVFVLRNRKPGQDLAVRGSLHAPKSEVGQDFAVRGSLRTSRCPAHDNAIYLFN